MARTKQTARKDKTRIAHSTSGLLQAPQSSPAVHSKKGTPKSAKHASFKTKRDSSHGKDSTKQRRKSIGHPQSTAQSQTTAFDLPFPTYKIKIPTHKIKKHVQPKHPVAAPDQEIHKKMKKKKKLKKKDGVGVVSLESKQHSTAVTLNTNGIATKSKKKKKNKTHSSASSAPPKIFEYTASRLFLPNQSFANLSKEQIPWLQADKQGLYSSSVHIYQSKIDPPKDDNDTNTNNTVPNPSLLPDIWYELPMSLIQRLNQEILGFCCYVSLSCQEKNTRSWVVNQISDLAKREFNADAQSRDENVMAHVFGSFACPEVCTFFGDVDIRLDGVIENDSGTSEVQQQPTHLYFVDTDCVESHDTKRPGKEKKNQATVYNRKKNDKVAKWRQALIALEATSSGPGTEDEVKPTIPIIDLTSDSVAIQKEDHNSEKMMKDPLLDNPEDTFLFVIDRQGIQDPTCISDEFDPSKSQSPNETAMRSSKDSALVQMDRKDIQKEDKTLFVFDRQGADSTCILDHSGTEFSNENVDSEHGYIQDDGRRASMDETDDADPMLGFKSSGMDMDEAQIFHNFRKICTKLKDPKPSTNTPDNEVSEILEVSVIQKPTTLKTKYKNQTRQMAIKALKKLGKRVRKEGYVRPETVEVRLAARVPIVTLKTRFGFESDILINHGDVIDTSAYATSQVHRFRSFAPVILILKTLLQQTGDLDKPFTGGIGSFKLYVLLSFHIQEHLKHGGNDSPAEVLLTFLLRFGHFASQFSNISRVASFTTISKDTVLESDGGRAECAFNVDKCKALFSESFSRLMIRLSLLLTNQVHSWLSCIIDSLRLRVLRTSFLDQQPNIHEKPTNPNGLLQVSRNNAHNALGTPKTVNGKRIRDLYNARVRDPKRSRH